MADDDLDLEDDDLDLGGDDFAGELDDMMGDDELGGDSGGGDDDSDSELDSFFEDLSSIEDMDEGSSEPAPAAAAVEAEAAPVAAAPAKAERAAPKEKKKGGKLKYIILLLLVAALGGGGYFYWFHLRTPEIILEEEPIVEETPIEQTIKIEKPVKKPIIIVEPPPEPVKPAAPVRQYLVQVATCTFDVCKEDYFDAVRRTGEPVYQRPSGEKYDFIELISSQVFTYREANEYAAQVNRKNILAGRATVKSQSNGYRVSMGLFPALDRAKEVKASVEKLIPGNNLIFNLEHVRRGYTTTKIFAGPYNSRNEANRVMQKLRVNEKFQGAFIVRY